MHFTSFFVATMSALGAAISLKSPLEGYTAVPMIWRGGVNTTDGTEVAVSGSIQEVHNELKSMLDVQLTIANPHPTGANEAKLLDSRSKANTICWVGGWGKVRNEYLQDGIDYLRRIGGDCSADPGPRVCARISCSWKTAIWLCNDTGEELRHGCADLAGYAEDIRTSCHTEGRNLEIQGQKFDTDNFNVIVGGDDC